MIIRFRTPEDYSAALAAMQDPSELLGVSPGSVAMFGLNVSRQTVHKWVNAGLLDYVVVGDDKSFKAGYITAASARRLRDLMDSRDTKLGLGGAAHAGAARDALEQLRKLYPGLYDAPPPADTPDAALGPEAFGIQPSRLEALRRIWRRKPSKG